MSERLAVPWFTTDASGSTLLGARCTTCGALSFPPTTPICRDPGCPGEDPEPVSLGGRGTLWSFTDIRFPPPEPFDPPSDPFEPYALAAVEVDGTGMVVLGQVATGTDPGQLAVGAPMVLTVEPLRTDASGDVELVWKWALA